jgi:hypothetical protein
MSSFHNTPTIQADSTGPSSAPLKAWHSYSATLVWARGSLDESSRDVALRAASLKIPKEIVLAEIFTRIQKAGDRPNETKITSQIDRAVQYVNGEGTKKHFCLPRSRFQERVLHRIAEKFTAGDVRQFLASRSALQPDQVSSDSFLRAIYRNEEKILVFTSYKSQGQALWPDCGGRLPSGSKDGVWFLVNPVDGRYHKNPRQGNKTSRRSEEAVTSFRFAVLESDQADLTAWLKCLVQMPLPIAAIYESGGRSIHALVQVNAATKKEWDHKMSPQKPILITLGADPNALTAVRLSRLPQAKRGDRIQNLLYLAPNPDAVPISNKPPFPKGAPLQTV